MKEHPKEILTRSSISIKYGSPPHEGCPTKLHPSPIFTPLFCIFNGIKIVNYSLENLTNQIHFLLLFYIYLDISYSLILQTNHA